MFKITAATIALCFALSAQSATLPTTSKTTNDQQDWPVFIQRTMDKDVARIRHKYRNAGQWLSGANLAPMPNISSVTEPNDVNTFSTHVTQKLTNYGGDSFYYGPVSIGTRGQVLNVDVDTGSADLWVQSGCKNCTSAQFQPSRSKTFQQTDQPFSIQYVRI